MTEKEEEEEDNHKERDEREEPSEERKQFHRFVGACTFCRISSVISAGTGYMGKDDMHKNIKINTPIPQPKDSPRSPLSQQLGVVPPPSGCITNIQ